MYFPDVNKIRKVRCVRFTEKMIAESECDIDVHVGSTADEPKEKGVLEYRNN